MTEEYPPSYVIKIKALDAIIFLIGLALLAAPVLLRLYPGDIDTTVHIALGALVAVLAVFRVLVAYGSAWVEIVLCALGVLVLLLPKFMHETYNPVYNMPHMIAGALIILLSVISAVLTFGYLRTLAPR